MKTDGRRERSRQTQEVIIKAAIHLAAEKGVEALTIADVARQAGVDRSTTYKFFRDRTELFNAIKEYIEVELLAPLSTLVSVYQVVQSAVNQGQATKLWANRIIAGDSLRDHGFLWDKTLTLIEEMKANNASRKDIDVEALAAIILVAAIIGPVVFQNTVGDGGNSEEMIKRYSDELEKLLRTGALQ